MPPHAQMSAAFSRSEVFMSSAKAWVAAVGAFLTALLAEWPSELDPITARDCVVALLAAVTVGGSVFTVPNRA